MRVRWPLLLVLCLFGIAEAFAIQVGQTRDSVVAQYGAPAEANHGKGTAIYRQGLWKVDVTYGDDASIKQLIFTKTDPLSEQEITSLLAQNTEGAPWREANIGGPTRLFQGQGGAMARCDRQNPRILQVNRGPFHPPIAQPAATQLPIRSPAAGQASAASAAQPSTSIRNSATPATVSPFTPWFIIAGVCAAISAAVKTGSKKRRASGRRVPRTRAARRAAASLQTWQPPAADERPSLEMMPWDDFELLVGELFRRRGYSVELPSGLGADGGKDLTVRKDGELFVVQCKKLAASNRVTATQMRDFFGLITAERATKGFFVTTGYFSADATRFAEDKPIKLVDGQTFTRLVEELSAPGENLYNVDSWIDTFAAHATAVDPECPFCRSPMELRTLGDGTPKWGCSRFPKNRCKGMRDVRERLIEAGRWQRR